MAKADYYGVVATGHELYDAADEGKNPYVEVMVRVVEVKNGGPFPVGHEIPVRLSLSEKAQEWTAKALRALGWRSGDITELGGLGDIMADLSVKKELYKGKMKDSFSIWERRPPRESLSQDKKNAFAARFASLSSMAAPVEVKEHNKAGDIPDKVAYTPPPAPTAADSEETLF